MNVTEKLPNAAKDYFALPVSDHIQSRDLVADVQKRIRIPDGAKFVLYASTADFFTEYGDENVEAEVPGDVSDGSAAELNPTMRKIAEGVTHVSVISESTCIVTASFYTK